MKNYSVFKAIFSILFTALLTATILVTFSPGAEYVNQIVPTALPAVDSMGSTQENIKKIVGILPGHYGFDSGFQCGAEYNFVKESDVDLRLAVMVRDYLENQGYTVDLLHEFDPKLSDYTSLALVSIHTNPCTTNGGQSGFNITTAGQNYYPSESKRLNDCLTYHYSQNSGLDFLGEYYAQGEENLSSFDSVNSYTTISVINAGYLDNDYRTISEKTEMLAKGIADGIICYVENDTVGSIYKAQPVTSLSTVSSGPTIYKIPLSPAMSE